MKISPKSFTVLNWQTIQKCQLFIESPGMYDVFVRVLRSTHMHTHTHTQAN